MDIQLLNRLIWLVFSLCVENKVVYARFWFPAKFHSKSRVISEKSSTSCRTSSAYTLGNWTSHYYAIHFQIHDLEDTLWLFCSFCYQCSNWARSQHRRGEFRDKDGSNYDGASQPFLWQGQWGCQRSPPAIPGALQYFCDQGSIERCDLSLSIFVFSSGESETVVLC